MKKTSKPLALLVALVIVAVSVLPLQALAVTNVAQLEAPTNFRFENTPGGVFNLDSAQGLLQNPGIGPRVESANRALVWDSVPGAVAYRVYAFTNATEINPANAYRTQLVDDAQIVIGHNSVTQARERFGGDNCNDCAYIFTHGAAYANVLCNDCRTIEPVNVDGYLAWHVMRTASRQDFDLPLPFRAFYFRVVAIAENEAGNSEMSQYTRAYPGARSVSPAQAVTLIEDARARGAAYPYFIFIQSGNLPLNMAGVANRLYIPFANMNPDYLGDNPNLADDDPADGPRNISAETNSSYVNRVAIEIQNHPAYIGAETLIFSG